MEVPPNEDSELSVIPSIELPVLPSIDTVDQQQDNVLHNTTNDGAMEQKQEIAEEEVRGTIEVIASTGKFWHDWEKLKSMLSFQLKKVLSEYPEAKASGEQQNTLGETFPELVKRLDEALLSFTEGPPFTLQRICEILLDALDIYPNLSKLALALEKNLSVSTTLAISSDPRLSSFTANPNESEEPKKAVEEPKHSSEALENGTEAIAGDKITVGDDVTAGDDGDEIMTEAEEVVNDDMKIDMALEEIVGSTETNPGTNSNS